MRGHIVWAAAVLGACMVLGGGLMALGVWVALDRSTARVEAALREHARATEQAGTAAGVPIREAVLALTAATEKHAGSIEAAGRIISEPDVTMKGPIAVQQPVRIAGPMEDGTLPVAATIGK